MSVVTVNALADACVEAAELAPRPPRALSAAEGVGEEDSAAIPVAPLPLPPLVLSGHATPPTPY